MTITITPLLVSGLALLGAFVVGFAAGIGLCLWLARDVDVPAQRWSP